MAILKHLMNIQIQKLGQISFSEYKIPRLFLNPCVENAIFSNSKFVNIHCRDKFLFSNSYASDVDKRCIFMKSLSVEHSVIMLSNCLQRRTFEQTQWKHIYQCKICDMPDKRLAEFNYKDLNNILCKKALLSKLKQDTHSQCNICLINESSNYLINI